VWDHHPTADELLDARIARGWVATPTRDLFQVADDLDRKR
jgi:hypothetical protein